MTKFCRKGCAIFLIGGKSQRQTETNFRPRNIPKRARFFCNMHHLCGKQIQVDATPICKNYKVIKVEKQGCPTRLLKEKTRNKNSETTKKGACDRLHFADFVIEIQHDFYVPLLRHFVRRRKFFTWKSTGLTQKCNTKSPPKQRGLPRLRFASAGASPRRNRRDRHKKAAPNVSLFWSTRRDSNPKRCRRRALFYPIRLRIETVISVAHRRKNCNSIAPTLTFCFQKKFAKVCQNCWLKRNSVV